MVPLFLEQLFAPHLSQQGKLSACVRPARAIGIWQLRDVSDWPVAARASTKSRSRASYS